MKRLGEFCPVNFLVLFGKFQIDITGQCKPLHGNERFALIYQCVFIQMIEIENTIGNFNNKLRLFGYSVRFYIIQTEIDRGVGNFRLDTIQPVIFYLMQKSTAPDNINQRMNIIGARILYLLYDMGIFSEIYVYLIICNLKLPESRFLIYHAVADPLQNDFQF